MAGSSTGNPSFSKERENAIETLIDMDPRGPSIRAAAILEDAQTNSLSARPHLLPTASIREVAHSLSIYCNQTPDSPSFRALPPINNERKRHILLYHEQLISNKTIQNTHTFNVNNRTSSPSDPIPAPIIAAPENLLRNLEKIWKDENLTKCVANHPIFSSKNSMNAKKKQKDGKETAGEDQVNDPTLSIDCESPTLPFLERILGIAVSDYLEKPSLAPFLLNVIMMYMNWRDEDTSFLQVGHLLSLLPCDDSNEKDVIHELNKVTQFLGDASFNYSKKFEEREKRLERKRARLKEEHERKKKEEEEKKKAETESNLNAEKSETENTEDQQRRSSFDHTTNAFVTPPRAPPETDINATDNISPSSSTSDVSVSALMSGSDTAGLSEQSPQPDPLHHHLLLAASVSLPDDFNAEDIIEMEHKESSSDSSSSSSDEDRNHDDINDHEDPNDINVDEFDHERTHHEEHQNHDDEEVLLQQCLALSLTHAAEQETPPINASNSVEISPEEDSDEDDEDEVNLSKPPPYPFLNFLGNNIKITSEHASLDLEEITPILQDGTSFFDPNIKDDFGAIPGQLVMTYLLYFVQQRLVSEKNEIVGLSNKFTPACPGGVGSTLFTNTERGKKTERSALPTDDDRKISFHLLCALVILLSNLLKETNASLAQLRETVRISKAKDVDDPADLHTPAHISSAESVLPTAASAVSLQEKGMRRKAAAAADAAAARREQRERKKGKLLKKKDICIESLEAVLNILLHQLVSTSIDMQYGVKIIDALKYLTDAKCASFSLCNLSIKVHANLFPIVYKMNLESQFLKILSQFSESVGFKPTFSSTIWTDESVHILTVDSVCHRLRQADTIESLVSLPVLSTLGTIVTNQNHETNVTKLYYAIVHKSSIKALLWNTIGSDKVLSGFHTNDGNPNSISLQSSSSLQFDSSRCADSIAILPNKTCVHQRASKTWGTVLSTTSFSPKTGVHKWAVKLDKCEKGHVFVGVATAQAGTRTYVGGDKHGWGAIGTQALWHHRSKIRGDYGSTFRTGSIIIVSLDTNVGTLSFGLLSSPRHSGKNSSSTDKLYSLSRRNTNTSSSTFIDWGIAFEGLPLDAKVYPAVGLYQRDDKVTILSVKNHKDDVSQLDVDGERRNESLAKMGIDHTLNILSKSHEILREGNMKNCYIEKVLPCLAANLCLIPFNDAPRWICGKYALQIIPILTEVIKLHPDNNVKCFEDGKWLIRAKSVDSSGADVGDVEEYNIRFKLDAANSITGKGKGESGQSKRGVVDITGTLQGTSIHLIEKWSKENDEVKNLDSCYVIQGRMSLDGRRFEGKSWNVKSKSAGIISGVKLDIDGIGMLDSKVLLCRAASHLAGMLCGDPVAIDMGLGSGNGERKWKENKILHPGLHFENDQIQQMLSDLKDLYYVDTSETNEACIQFWNSFTSFKVPHDEAIRFSLDSVSKEIDDWASEYTGGQGSLSKISEIQFSTAKRTIVAALLYHMQLFQTAESQHKARKTPSQDVASIWLEARALLESVLRSEISKSGPSKGFKVACEQMKSISTFLIRIKRPCMDLNCVKEFYKKTSMEDLTVLEKEMGTVNRQAYLRAIGFKSMNKVIYSAKSDACTDASLQPLTKILSRKHSNSATNGVGSYLYGLEGSNLDSVVRIEIAKLQRYLFEKLQCNVLDSTSLVILSCLQTTFDNEDFELISRKNVFGSLSKILEKTRKHLEDPPINEMDSIQTSIEWHQKRTIFSATFCVIYILIMQICTDGVKPFDLGSSALSMILRELRILISLIQDRTKKEKLKNATNILKHDIKGWSKICFLPEMKLNQLNDIDEEVSPFQSCLRYLQRHGGIKHAPNNSLSSASGTERICLPLESPENYLSGLLNTLFSLFRSNVISNHTEKDNLVNLLLEAAEDRALPCRARILRLMRLAFTDQMVDAMTLKRILILAGNEGYLWTSERESLPSKNSNSQFQNHHVRREAVSLLRVLYERKDETKDLIVDIVKTYIEKDWEIEEEIVKGCLSFIGGIITNVSLGSYVLFKPTSASEKSSSRNVAGGGVESILSGLSRKNAYAGVVSNIDFVNGSCEVILVNRAARWDETSLSENSTPGMMVRAARVPLCDVVSAEEIPLVIDYEMLGIVKVLLSRSNHLASVRDQLKDSNTEVSVEQARNSFKMIYLSTMSIRNCLQILSDKQILQLLSDEKRSFSLPMILEIASTLSSSFSNESLTSLRLHENEYVQLYDDILALKHRMKALKMVSLTALNFETTKKKVGSLKKSDLQSDLTRTTTPPVTADDENESVSTADTNSANALNNASIVENNAAASSTASDEEEAHLREAAIAQMAELGLPRSWSELALRRTGGTNVEAAVHFCLERGGEMEHMLIEERERNQSNNSSSSINSANADVLIQQLLEMGFPDNWCRQALEATRNNVDDALTWILTNGERLSSQDVEDEDEDEEDDEDDDEFEMVLDDINDDDDDEDNEAIESPSTANKDSEDHHETSITQSNDVDDGSPSKPSEETDQDASKDSLSTPAWTESICPLRFVSGRSSIDSETLSIAGLSSGGFSSVGTKGILLTSGKWYYEAELLTAGCLQIGWADGSFAGHCQADKGDGCGDGPSSWAFDGWRRYRWHGIATEWGSRWQVGDIIGCSVDMDNKIVSFTLNGQGEEIGMGKAFEKESFRPCGGVYACASFNWKEKLKISLKNFKYGPPEGYRGIGDAILSSVQEREVLIKEEELITENDEITCPQPRFLCDFSDGEHGHELFAWQHRYYGSDASVHLGSGKGNGRKKIKNIAGDATPGITHQLKKAWEKIGTLSLKEDESVEYEEDDMKNHLEKGYQLAEADAYTSLHKTMLTLSVLYSKKLVLQIVLTLSEQFSLQLFQLQNESEISCAKKFWRVLDSCCSLRSTGWVGEASAMAIAAEALGLGISTNDSSSSSSSRNNSTSTTIGLSQMLTPVMTNQTSDRVTFQTFAACAEAAIGGEGGGATVFLRDGLQSAVSKSECLQRVLVAAIRKAIRLLAVVEYSKEDSINSDAEDSDGISNLPNESNGESNKFAPDARLASFWTGLLLSPPVLSQTKDNKTLFSNLFEAWSIGLLSASAPWRMVCAFTISGILNLYPDALEACANRFPTLANFYGRLESTVARRVWAERAAYPVCSRYVQAFIELLSSVRMTPWFQAHKFPISVDAATPLPFSCNNTESWEWDESWISADKGFQIYTGTVEYMVSDWKIPPPSHAQIKMDTGEGPPMLRVGCHVLRGSDWKGDQDDGKDIYDNEKKIRERLKEQEKQNVVISPEESGETQNVGSPNEEGVSQKNVDKQNANESKKKKKYPPPKLPIGTVLSIESWNGIPGAGRRIRWNLTGKEGVYRFGGDGGRYDIVHVEVNDKHTKVKKRYPVPESAEQCAARHGFGLSKKYNIFLRIQNHGVWNDTDQEMEKQGILEYPDFGAGVKVHCLFHSDGAITISEKALVYGSKNYGWEPRFGQPGYIEGSTITLTPTSSYLIPSEFSEVESNRNEKSAVHTDYEEFLGSSSYIIKNLRNRADGSKVRATSEMRLCFGRRSNLSNNGRIPSNELCQIPPPILFDDDFHSSSMSLSRDRKTVSCISPEGRGTAFASMGFTKGVHYWEVKLEHADVGSVFIGVAEKPYQRASSSSQSFSDSSRLNRWLGWGFVNFRATYTAGAERVFGAHCHNTDTVGVLLDCDAGRISFFFDGVKYGEHIMNDLGCAFENVSPFGFNADGCGSGGRGQGAPSGIEGGRGGRYPSNGAVRPRALWPVIGLKNPGDKVTFGGKWMTNLNVDSINMMENVVKVDEVLHHFGEFGQKLQSSHMSPPKWFIKESYQEYNRWLSSRYCRSVTRGSGPSPLSNTGLNVDLDKSPFACASACALLGLPIALLSGDIVAVKRSAGRMLELPEEARVLGACQGKLFYEIISQKSEGGSLTEGGGRAWFWDESEVVDNALKLVKKGLGLDIKLPILDRFKCTHKGGIRVVYSNGAVVRSDLEIMDVSINIGTIPKGTVIPQKDVLERRVNSLGVVRYRIKYEPLGGGWISSRIRGGKEEAIIEAIYDSEHDPDEDDERNENDEPSFQCPNEAAAFWMREYEKNQSDQNSYISQWKVDKIEDFEELLSEAQVSKYPQLEFDSILAQAVSAISDFSAHSDPIECEFKDIVNSILFAVKYHENNSIDIDALKDGNPNANRAAAEIFLKIKNSNLPSSRAILARIAMLKAFNRRARFALPWMPLRPAQEGSAIFGGLGGYGASVERAGRSSGNHYNKKWFQAQSIPTRIRSCRRVIFVSTKETLLDSIMDATTIPTPTSHDEYELPREVRTVRVNRLKARRAMASSDELLMKKHCIFAQLQHEMRGWSGVALRRGHVAKGHGGQKRAFKVKLVGEGVNDYSGPYREVFTDAIAEVASTTDSGKSVLGILEPTPNNSAEIGDDRSLLMFGRGNSLIDGDKNESISMLTKEEKSIMNAFSSVFGSNDESVREIEDSLVFLGKLTGTACRHGIPVDLPLSIANVWQRISEETVDPIASLAEIDLLASHQFMKNPDHSNLLLRTQQRMLNSFTEGLSSVIPTEIFSIFTGDEVQNKMCGNPEIDVGLLQRVVEYDGYDEDSPVITFFWEVLREMNNHERKLFLQFVWARSRLPLKESDFDAPFKIQKDMKTRSQGNEGLPGASTCFFSLTLPDYKSKEILKQKLMFAIENVTTMESDYVTNDAEVSEGWRGLY